MDKKIIYYISRWYTGTAYKNINLMKDNFGGIIVKDNVAEVREIIKKERKIDLMVVRGDVRADFKIAIKYKIPYILIENDISSLRMNYCEEYLVQEKNKIENASAIIFTSKEHAKYYKKKEGWKLPYYDIIHTKPLKKDLDFEPKKKLKGLHLVYAGGMVQQWRRHISPFGYRCYHEIFKKFIDAGWKVHVYSANCGSEKLSEYKDIGCKVHENLPYKALLREMSQYTAGLHSYNKEGVKEKAFDYTQTCRPNKLWDYLAAGIPTIGYQGGNGMKIYNKKWGLVINDLEEKTLKKLPGRLAKIKITKRMRTSNVMDRDIKKYEKIINQAIKAGEAKALIQEEPERYKNPNNEPFPKLIMVTNKGPRMISRANRIFLAYSTTEPTRVNEREFKEIKAHVGLKIKHLD